MHVPLERVFRLKDYTMTFAFIPKAQYSIGQIITVHGKQMRVESYTHTGRNVVVTTLDWVTNKTKPVRFERIVCICTDKPAITAIKA
jgi:CRISPR/Cas system CMR-associated protein Cmr3 (group 5 of RAMP superfamily)